MADVTRKRGSMTSTGATTRSHPTGTHVDVNPDESYGTHRYGLIVSTGPNGESDFTDNRYWVKPAYIVNATSANAIDPAVLHADENAQANEAYPLCVTNIAETLAATHLLTPIDGTYPVHFWEEIDDGGNFRWVMSSGCPPCHTSTSEYVPVTFGSTGATADTTEVTDTKDKTVIDTRHVRTYYDTSTGTFYGFTRDYTYNCGVLKSISVETRYTIVDLVAC